MRFIPTLLATALFAACGGADQPAPPAGPSLADFAGAWQATSMLEGVENPVPSTMSLSADGSGASLSLEGRPNIPLTLAMVGDSLIAESGEYESILRAGVMVSIRFASVLSDGMMMGNMVATYRTPDGMEQVTGTTRGTRIEE